MGDHKDVAGDAPGRIFFLFITRSGLEHPDLWRAFFASAGGRDLYRGYVICTGEGACEAGARLARVAPVPTRYCKDLASPMAALLAGALNESASPRDKFVFLSESTLPTRPFSDIYAALTTDAGSDLCFADKDDWPTLSAEHGGGQVTLVKTSQWGVLSRAHAQSFAANWPGILNRSSVDTMQWSIPAPPQGSARFNGILKSGATLCTDEWATFASIFGAVRVDERVDGLSTGRALPIEHRWHGACRTWTYFNAWKAHPEAMALVEKFLADPESNVTCAGSKLKPAHPGELPSCSGTHPALLGRVSDGALRLLRNSSFLFARKFARGAVLPAQFSGITLAA